MPILYLRTACFITLGIIFVACESDQSKLERLQGEQASACLLAQADSGQYQMARYPGGMTQLNIGTPATPAAESLGRRYYDHRAKCELATRDLNKFMR